MQKSDGLFSKLREFDLWELDALVAFTAKSGSSVGTFAARFLNDLERPAELAALAGSDYTLQLLVAPRPPCSSTP